MLAKSIGVYGFRSATLSTLLLLGGWVVFGLISFVIRFSHVWSPDIASPSRIWEYLVPPLLIGGPIAVLDTNILREQLRRFSFPAAVALRLALFVAMITITYGIIGIYLKHLSGNELLNYITYFLVLWGTGSLLLLSIRNLAEHFDRRQLFLWVTGAYHRPVVEERIFLFIDLNDSTSIAERIGHVQYFHFLSDYFRLMARVIEEHHGEVYQHVGDEIIVTWPMDLGRHRNNALNLFFAIRRTLNFNKGRFIGNYGVAPTIKGSLHGGLVTKGELYGKRREFIYTGDVLNTTARMQALCKANEASLAISADLLQQFRIDDDSRVISLGVQYFRGKAHPLEVFVIESEVNPLPVQKHG